MPMTRRALIGSAATGLVAGLAGVSSAAEKKEPAEKAVAAAGAGRPRLFKLGMVTYNFAAEWDLPTLLSRLKASGFSGFEARTTHKHGIEPGLAKDQRPAIRKQIEDSGIVLWCLGTVCEFHSPDAKVVQKNIDDCKTWVELAHDMGARCVKVRPNGLPKDVEEAKTLEQIGRSLRTCGEAAGPAGVEIVCEVHGSATSEPARMRRIMDVAAHKSVGVTWNSNGSDVKDGSVKESFELLKPFIKSCHINDLLSGYPYRELFALMRESGYDRYTEMEVTPPLESKSESDNVRYLKYYRALWDELSKA